MASIYPVKHVGIKRKNNKQGLKIEYCIWEGCVEAKWMEVQGLYLVNPKFIKLFKQRHFSMLSLCLYFNSELDCCIDLLFG